MKLILVTLVWTLFVSIWTFPTLDFPFGEYACLDQQIGDEQCSFYGRLYQVTEAELFCHHWGSRCCLSCIEKRLSMERLGKQESKQRGGKPAYKTEGSKNT
ncbi:uncharacterized protein LOC111126271 [Crassostrea virginica]|uniref:Uncharacterized protein LOC111126271 n=1 Tax=Crassostrea virginica TaxID=6565 RepID=A0A8B8DED6_CRAVI|nr:uncharacterized protein LOC111126271 [Crassostrea virginica]